MLTSRRTTSKINALKTESVFCLAKEPPTYSGLMQKLFRYDFDASRIVYCQVVSTERLTDIQTGAYEVYSSHLLPHTSKSKAISETSLDRMKPLTTPCDSTLTVPSPSPLNTPLLIELLPSCNVMDVSIQLFRLMGICEAVSHSASGTQELTSSGWRSVTP